MGNTKFINTNIKFQFNGNNAVSFITKVKGSWKGCRQNDKCKKLIVVPGKEVLAKMKENILYKARLVPMVNKKGYVAVELNEFQHDATIETFNYQDSFQIKISWGNHNLIYDPTSKNPNFNSMTRVMDILKQKTDIRDLAGIMEDFQKRANIEIAYYAAERL